METLAIKAGEEGETQSILETLNDYIQGGSTGDIERLRSAFHPDARIRSVRMGELVHWTLQEYLDIVAKAPIQERQSKILSYGWDGNIGSAHLHLTYTTFQFIDRFNLVKLDRKWLIMDKVFNRQETI